MDEKIIVPEIYDQILSESEKIHFSMPSDIYTGNLLRTLVSSKPAGHFLELGTGTGLALSWMSEALGKNADLISVDNNEQFIEVARHFFVDNPQIKILFEDGDTWIKNNQQQRFDLIFADSWPGKFRLLDETLNLLKTGGFYIVDDLLPQPNWPDDHQQSVDIFIAALEAHRDLVLTKLNWSTGVIIATKLK